MVALAGAVSILALGAVFSEGPTAVWRHSGIGAGRAELEGTGANAEQNFMNAIRRQCIWEAEGVETSVAIPATDSLAFVVNGKSDGNAYSDAGTQIGLGLIGPLLHESPKNDRPKEHGAGRMTQMRTAVRICYVVTNRTSESIRATRKSANLPGQPATE